MAMGIQLDVLPRRSIIQRLIDWLTAPWRDDAHAIKTGRS